MSIRWISRALCRVARGDDGLGMPEILVALMVFAVIATTAAYGMLNALTLTQHSRSNETAMSIASSDLDQMRLAASADANGIFSVLSTNSAISKTVGGRVYNISRQVTWQTTTGATGACGTGTGTLQYKNVTETVSWIANTGSTQSVTMSSAIAPLSNINSDATGTIIVMVTGASGQPVPGLKVTVTPTSGGGGSALSNAPQNTDNAGCSFGLLVDPGTYTVSASLSGDIDPNQSATTTTQNPVSVVAGQNTVVTFTYDQAATFPLSYPTGATLPTNLPISFWHATPGTTAFNTTAIPPVTATPPSTVKAFPWSDGYTIVAGTYVYTAATSTASCLDTNPASWTTARAADGAVGVAPTVVAAAPGATAPGTAVQMGTLTVSNSTLSGKFVTAVTATTPGAGDPGCAAGQTLTFPKLTGGSATLALPFGTWRLYYGTSSGSTSTALPSGWIGTITSGVINTLTSSTSSITLDPRAVPAS